MNVKNSDFLALARRLGLPESKLQVLLDESKRRGAYVDAHGNIFLNDNVLQALGSSELIAAVKQFILQKFSPEQAEETRYYSTAQVCRLLKVSRKTLQKYRNNGYIGFVKAPTGRKYLYTQKHIDNFLKSNENG